MADIGATLDLDAEGTLGFSPADDIGPTLELLPDPPPPPEPPDSVAPVIENITPPAGASISKFQAVMFDVVEETALCDIFVYVTFTDGVAEVVHDGDQFLPRFLQLSQRVAITNGFRYTLRRVGGWPSDPTVRIKAIDRAGNVSTN